MGHFLAIAWENSQHFTMPSLFLSKMTSEEQVQKSEIFHTDDVSLPRSW